MSRAASLKIAMVGSAGPVTNGTGEGGPRDAIGSASGRGADLIVLPQLSFSEYFPAVRDREALELGERLPSARMRAAVEAADGAFVCASVYECVGEGVFYARGELASAGQGTVLASRQRLPEAAHGRYEQMFFSPGHGPREVSELPWGWTGLLVGADLRSVGAWAELAGLGARLVIGSVSEDHDGWARTVRVAAGLAIVNGLALALVNRAPAEKEPDFAGGELVIDPQGREIPMGEDGLFELRITGTKEDTQ